MIEITIPPALTFAGWTRADTLGVLVIALIAGSACLPAFQVHERAFWKQRDWALLGLVALGGTACALTGLWWPVPLVVWFLARWRSTAELPSLVVWVAIVGVWVAASSVPASAHRWLAWALVVVAWAQTAIAAVQWAKGRRQRRPRAPRGSFGQRTLLASFLAIVVMLVPVTGSWWVAAPLVGGLILTSSWVAWLAALAGLIVLWPAIGLAALALVSLVLAMAIVGRPSLVKALLDHGTLRGTSVDSIRQRARTWLVTVRLWPTTSGRLVFGTGPMTLQYDLLRWDHRFGGEFINGYAHNEPLQMTYEYGLCGLATVVLFAYAVGLKLAIGDPWSAAAVAGAVAACGTIICRTPATGLPWLAVCAMVAGR